LGGETKSGHEIFILSWKNRPQIELELPRGYVPDNRRPSAAQTSGERG
jgi:hypothetical protein